jgi:hypothetical protein
MLKKWNSFINESMDFKDMLSTIKMAFVELIEDDIVNIFIENDRLNQVTLQTNFPTRSTSTKSEDFYTDYDKIHEHIKDIQTAITRLESENIICNISYKNIGFNFHMLFYQTGESGSFYIRKGNLISLDETKIKEKLMINSGFGIEVLNIVSWHLRQDPNLSSMGNIMKMNFSVKGEMLRTHFPLIDTNTKQLGTIFNQLKIGEDFLVTKLIKYTNEYPWYILVELNSKFKYEVMS